MTAVSKRIAFFILLILLGWLSVFLPANTIVYAQTEAAQEQQTPAKISESFKTEAVSTYTVSENGTTRVEHRFTITNLKPTTYLKQYLIKLQFPSVSEITATSQGQNTQPVVAKEGPTTNITLNFDDEIVGEGKTRTFTISYTTRDVSVGSGNVLEIRIPALSGALESQHVVHVKVPLRYGKPVRTNPRPDTRVEADGMLQLKYDNFPKNGISALFGSEQTYALTTRYLLKNPSSSLGYTQIALPPDTSYQQMEYQLLEPLPKSMKIDEDGNWIATYDVAANTVIEVHLTTRVHVTLEPNPLVPIVEPAPEHLAEKPFWQTSSGAIADFTKTAIMRDIYDAVIDTLVYDTDRVARGDVTTRLGAEGALATPTAAVCQEYADLLIAGWRRTGVPARRLNGYAYSENQEIRPLSFRGTILHAWVDYFDQSRQVWRMVDPTWEDTTGGVDYFSEFDLNHIVLSINGYSSSDPAPAGSFTESPEEARLDVKVVAASASARPQFTARLQPTTVFGVAVPGSYTATIKNETGRAWYDTHITMAVGSELSVSPSQLTNTFLPFEQKIIPVTLTSPLQKGLLSTPLDITLVAAGETEPYAITQENYTAAPQVIITLAAINPSTPLGVIAILSFLTAGSLLVFGRKRKAAVRWQSQKSKKTPEQLPPSKTPHGTDSPDGANGDGRPLA